MHTIIIKINKNRPEKEKIKIAAELIKKGCLVAFPTETVYGLGANASNAKAVEKIFRAKGRPFDDPLIIHIDNKKDIYKIAKEVPRAAKILMNKFWPGPLTIILKKSKAIPKITTAGLNTVAIRLPNHKVAVALIKEAGKPIAAPSANIFGKPSPTDAEHVIEDLNGKIDCIIDSGKTNIGLESTVIDLTTEKPTLLRPGGIPLEKLKNILGNIEIHPAIKLKKIKIASAPGMKYRHYAPNAKVILVNGEYKKVREKIKELAYKYRKKGKKIFIMREKKISAKELFRIFRNCDKEKVDFIIAEGIKESGLGLAIMNRLKRAANKIIKI